MSDPVTEWVSVVGPEHVLTDPGLISPYATDWGGRWGGLARAVVRPGWPVTPESDASAR